MRIVIDLQGAQGVNASHGIGRFSLSLVRAIIRQRGQHEILLVLNGLLPEAVESIRSIFYSLLPEENIRTWFAPGPVDASDEGNAWRRRCAEVLREGFIAGLKPDAVIICSLFEGLRDNGVVSIGVLNNRVPTFVILYDSMPSVYQESYLEDPVVKAWYQEKLGYLGRATGLLAISESARKDSVRVSGVSEKPVINMSAAADPLFCVSRTQNTQELEIRRRYGLLRPFVMTGGMGHQGNMDGLVRAYATLPVKLRGSHQLAVVCPTEDADRKALEELARKEGLREEDFVITGFVPDDDLVVLYNICTLFVLPLSYEDFGLPVLEALACGAAVIGSNTLSVAEYIGRDDALFDPCNLGDISAKVYRALTDDSFRESLRRHAVARARDFSLDESARRALAFCEQPKKERVVFPDSVSHAVSRLRLAYVSPMPPERSGIAGYSAQLLPELARYYDIEIVVAQKEVSDPWVIANCSVRSVEWFLDHAQEFDRVIYHFGNSQFHTHMFDLLALYPGVVVLHDFFLSGVVARCEVYGERPSRWTSELQSAHGYGAVKKRFLAEDLSSVIWEYPCNLSVLQQARGMIVHSQFSRHLASEWYGDISTDDWAVIPLLRVPFVSSNALADKVAARRDLGIPDDAFLVCSFGVLGPMKLNDRLLEAWLASHLAENPRCLLTFVGDHDRESDHGQALTAILYKGTSGKRVHVTGWVDEGTYQKYLRAADVAVQLRAQSRGETSAAVLDCMNYGLATIINAHGSMAELPEDGVWTLPDACTDTDIVDALQALWEDGAARDALGRRAQQFVRRQHAPAVSAERYFRTIENFYVNKGCTTEDLVGKLGAIDGAPRDNQALMALAVAISKSSSPSVPVRQILVDVSALVQEDLKTGIQRVVRSVVSELLQNPPKGYRVEPVYATHNGFGYYYARQFTLRFLGCPPDALQDASVDVEPGDVFLGLDFATGIVYSQAATYREWRWRGVKIWFFVYDLLPVVRPEWFPQGEDERFERWLSVITQGDGAICISQKTADDLKGWYSVNASARPQPYRITASHIGADLDQSSLSRELPRGADIALKALEARPTFIVVGTIEPRKGHKQCLGAFDRLWQSNVDVNLVVVGKPGWMVESLVEELRDHREIGSRLFWLNGISDKYLEKIYESSTCLIVASEDEGFGLPLIEAAQRGLPIIARDIPVFREVAGKWATYFAGSGAGALADTISRWLEEYAEGRHCESTGMPWLTWEQSVNRLKEIILASQASVCLERRPV